MERLTKKQFKDRSGVSQPAITKAIKSGRVICEKDSLIDLSNSINREYLNKQREKKKTAKLTQKEEAEKTGLETQGDPVKATSASSQPDKINGAENKITKNQAEINRLVVVTEKEKVRLAKDKGTIILRDLVSRLFGNLHSIIVNYFHPLGQRLAPELAGLCGVSDSKIIIEMEKKINKEVMRALAEFKKESEKEL